MVGVPIRVGVDAVQGRDLCTGERNGALTSRIAATVFIAGLASAALLPEYFGRAARLPTS